MPSSKVILAAAGSRKTTSLVSMASGDPSRRTLVLTYTIENVATIRSYFVGRCGMVPQHITIQSWYSFLLQEGVRPYQNVIYPDKRIESIYFGDRELTFRPPKSKPSIYYMRGGNLIYKDHLAEFAHEANSLMNNAVIKRLEKMYEALYIDEIQDMSGYDWEIIASLMRSKIEVCCVGDPRQATYSTSNSLKNSMHKGGKCAQVFKGWAKKNLCIIDEWTDCYRSNQIICDHADKLFPTYTATTSKFFDTSDHDGIFKLRASETLAYFDRFKPMVLRYQKNSNTMNLPACNIGVCKGKTFNRILIFPTQPILKYLASGDLAGLAEKSKSSLYVAITRARYSVAYVVENKKVYEEINISPYTETPSINQ
jgi:DNA helicase-2/ATP-dependent DNA helicase PcrA